MQFEIYAANGRFYILCRSWCKLDVSEDTDIMFLFKKVLNDSQQQSVTSFYLCVYLWPFPRSYIFTQFMSFSVLCSLKKDERSWHLSMFSFSVMTQGH